MFESVQAVLDPQGRSVGWIGELAWAMMLGGTLIFAIVMLLAICGIAPRTAGTRRSTLGGGFAFPVLALISVLAYALIIGEAFSRDAPREPLRVELTSKDSWWEVRYEPLQANRVLANELRVPLRRPVELILSAATPARFLVPDLGLEADVLPGHPKRLVVTARNRGVFFADGSALPVIAEEIADFDEWLARQSAPSVAPTDPRLREGRAAFFRAGCERCHAIRGTAARGRTGPDLTHVGARRSLTTDRLDEHLRELAPEKRELRAIASYLTSLK